MARITQKAPETLAPQRPVGPAKPASTPITGTEQSRVSTTPPASGFQTGTPGLQGKFAYAPALRTGAFASPPGHKIGLNRPSEVLGPNKMTVGDLLVRIEEHLDNSGTPTAHDLALMNGAFNVLGNS